MELQEMFVQPVEGDDDLFAFRFDFEGKALDGQELVTELENGDLIIEGYAAVFDGTDREGENFTDGAFQHGIKAALERPSGLALCYHHKMDRALGKVLSLEEEEGKGLRMRARVDGAIRQHPELGTYYEQIKRGTLNALSVGGFFRRKLTENGPKISRCDFTEISVTPVPIHPGTNFAVVAGKALSDMELPRKPKKATLESDIRDSDANVLAEIAGMWNTILDSIERRGSGPKGTFGGEPIL